MVYYQPDLILKLLDGFTELLYIQIGYSQFFQLVPNVYGIVDAFTTLANCSHHHLYSFLNIQVANVGVSSAIINRSDSLNGSTVFQYYLQFLKSETGAFRLF